MRSLRRVSRPHVSQEVPAWEEGYCNNPRCSAVRLFYRPVPGVSDGWFIAHGDTAGPMEVASSTPFCPACGGDLAPASPIRRSA